MRACSVSGFHRLPRGNCLNRQAGRWHGTGLLLLLLLFFAPAIHSQSLLESLAIKVSGGSRAFIFSNKEWAFLSGETNSESTSHWQGFSVSGHEYLDDYSVQIDGRPLDRSHATTSVYPDCLRRVYPNGVVEELRLADSIPVFCVTLRSREAVGVDIAPLVTDGTHLREFIVGHREHALVLARKAHGKRTPDADYPVWLAVGGKDFEAVHTPRTVGDRLAPFSLTFGKAKVHRIAFAVADESPAAESLIRKYLTNEAKYISTRRKRIEQILNESIVETENKRFDVALAWAKVSLDALVMNQPEKGILAGVPGFTGYRGRDTFVSLPGAMLVTGRFTEARQILLSFAAHQQIDTSSPDYGRIPGLTTPNSRAYDAADVTPRFVILAKEYIERSGDAAFATHIYPVIKRSVEGTLKYRTDSLGYLTHGDTETWMDAAGPDGPWTPRGNRANDVQGLWIRQLEAGIWFAIRLGDSDVLAKWVSAVGLLRIQFHRDFVSRTADFLIDHINADGTRDTQLRPNQIFTSSGLDDDTRAKVLHSVVNKLTYEYGVASLAQDDHNFRPFHNQEPNDPGGAAHHNGTVSTWLQGAVISDLCYFGKQEFAYRLTTNTVHRILDRGAVGTEPELLDAIPEAGEDEPRLSGMFSHARGLGEFIRNFYDDYLGVCVNRLEHTLTIRPRLPRSLGSVKATINLDGRSLPIEISRRGDLQSITINAKNLRVGGTATINLLTDDGKSVNTLFQLRPNAFARFELRGGTVGVSLNGKKHTHETQILPATNYDRYLEPLVFAVPIARTKD